MPVNESFPLSVSLLRHYKIILSRHTRSNLVGGHRMRHKGQSLEFRDFVPYTFGDDIRHVDWRASARCGTPENLLIRKFVAEEQMSLVISIDCRATMELPNAMPKIQIAKWIAEAIATIALGSEDRVVLHRLFGPGKGSCKELKGVKNFGRIRSALRMLTALPEPEEVVNLKVLRSYLKPTAVWLIVTDMYFDSEMQLETLARAIANAQVGFRWIILVDLDSWTHEKALLGEGYRRIEGPGMVFPHSDFNIDDETLQKVEANIENHKRTFLKLARRGAINRVHWRWPQTARPEPIGFFKKAFFEDRILQRLFMREN